MKIIAYYLPQYYPFKENNDWWGEGFTEWTNVGKAKPLFKSHYQPKVPRDLGYYDLRIPEVRQQQADLAKEAGISGFCYWHYWFGDGKRLLDLPFREVLNSGKPDFPFCLGWANESWKSKVWSNDNSLSDKVLIEQKYNGDKDIEDHFFEILPAIKDPRYIKIDGKPVFVIYKPFLIPDIINFFTIWNNLSKQHGFDNGFYFIGHTIDNNEIKSILELGFNSVNVVRIGEHRFNPKVIKKILLKLFFFKFLNKPLKLNYAFISKYFIQDIDKHEDIIPTIIPNWDHTPRSGKNGVVFHNSSPKLFKMHLLSALEIIRKKPKEQQILFLKSWNEWGEGNYMEPDLRFGRDYINVLNETVNSFKNESK